jgi:2,3-dimethylmalate lyase
LLAYRDEAGVDWVQFESPHSVNEIRAARAAVTGPFSFMKGKLGRYLDLDEHLALGVTIAWYPGFTHHVTWAALCQQIRNAHASVRRLTCCNGAGFLLKG